MPLPPAKRQKRLVALSSEDDNDWEHPMERTRGNGNTKNSRSTATVKQRDTSGIASNRSLPTRCRIKPGNTNAQLRSSAAVKASPVPSPQKSTRTAQSLAGARPSRPISSFFSAAANQSQQVNGHGWPKEESPEVEVEEEDVIEDDSPNEDDDKDELRGLQDTTRLVLDRRKKPLALAQATTTSTQGQKLPSSRRRFKINGNVRERSTDIAGPTREITQAVDSRPWAEKFGPSNLDELAVHKKKVSDIRAWLGNVLQCRSRKRLLILRGPSGAGKTATIYMLAKAMDFELSEWRNPVGSDFSSEGYSSMAAQFEDFLGRSGKFGGLDLADNAGNAAVASSSATALDEKATRRKVILLEEFPNTFLGSSLALRSFRSNILQYLATSVPSMGASLSHQKALKENITPVVMIITETRLTDSTTTSDIFTASRLLGHDILSHPGVSMIDFNPIAPTLLTKALDLAMQKEARHSGRRRVPGPSVLKKLGEAGDVRSAISSLEFLCIRGEDGDDWGGRVVSRATKGSNATAVTKMEQESLEMVTQRESSLGLFHAVGKVVYNKRDVYRLEDHNGESLPEPPDHMPEHIRSKIPQVSVDHLIEETGTDTSTFVAALHENYVLSCEGLDFTNTLNGCLEALSDSDLLSSPRRSRFGDSGIRSFQGAASDSLRQDEITFQVAVRGLLFALPDPVKRRAHPIAGKSGGKNDTYKMFYPTSARLSRQKEEIESLVDTWSERLRGRVSNSDTLTHPEPIHMNINITKSELILERLPYITKIEQRNPSLPLSQPEKITQFLGISAPDDDFSGEEEEGESVATTANGKAGSSGVVKAGREANAPVLRVEKEEVELGRLWLSDDDIVDD